MKATKTELQAMLIVKEEEIANLTATQKESMKIEYDLRNENTRLRFTIRSLIKQYSKLVSKTMLLEAGLKPGVEED